MIITFNKNSFENVVPDGRVEEKAKALLNKGEDFTISSALLFDQIRILVKQKHFNFEDVFIKFVTDQNLELTLLMDNDGRISDWPIGFCDTHIDILSKLI